MSLLEIEPTQRKYLNAVKATVPEFEYALSVFSYRNKCLLNIHNLDNNGNLTVGKAVDQKVFTTLIEKMKFESGEQHNQVSINPSNLLVNTKNLLVWHTKSERRRMWFTEYRKSLMVWYPPLLWVCINRSVYVFALASNARPHEQSYLYRAPLMNISKHGSFCLGGARLPKVISSGSLSDIENCLYEAKFSHLNDVRSDEAEYMTSNKAHIKYWREKEKSNTKWKVKDSVRVGTFGEMLRQWSTY